MKALESMQLAGNWPRRALLLYEGTSDGGDFRHSMQAGLEAHGCQVICRRTVENLPTEVDLILGYGPFTLTEGNLLPAARRLTQLPADERPRFTWWLTEGIPQPWLALGLTRLAARARILADQILSPQLRTTSHSARVLLKGHRLRTLGQLLWSHGQGVLDLLVVTSGRRADYLRTMGLPAMVAPLGYHPIYGVDLGLERTIDAAFLGNLRSSRRQKLLPPLLVELSRRGIRVEVRDNLYGRERSEFLNRSKIMLNILRAPQDFVGQRYLLGAANKAMIVSESVQDSAPFTPNVHLVTADHRELAEQIAYYLAHPKQRWAIAETAHHFVTSELTIEKQIGHILTQLRCPDDHRMENPHSELFSPT